MKSWSETCLLYTSTDSTFSSSERFVTCQESETFSFFTQQHSSKVTMAATNFTVVSYRTRDAECLQTDTDSFSSFSSVCTTFFNSNGSTYNISPFCIFKTDRLSFFTRFIRIKSMSFTDRDVYKRQIQTTKGCILIVVFLLLPSVQELPPIPVSYTHLKAQK